MDARSNDTLSDQAAGFAGLRGGPPPRPAYPHHLAADHELPDGMVLRTRAISPSDRRRHWRFLSSLSLQTRYQRLMSARNLLPGELRRMVEIDYRREMALVAAADVDGEERILAVARYVREASGGHAADRNADGRGAAEGDAVEGDAANRDAEDLAPVAEFAIVVADAWQRRGIGKLLLQRLREVAQDAGVRQLAGLTLSTNRQMISLARRLGFEISRERDDWTVKRVTWQMQDAVEERVQASPATTRPSISAQ